MIVHVRISAPIELNGYSYPRVTIVRTLFHLRMACCAVRISVGLVDDVLVVLELVDVPAAPMLALV